MVKKKIIYSEEVDEFLSDLDEKPKKKILFNISQIANGKIDNELFSKLDDYIWEFRTFYGGIWYRILAFWDTETETLIVTTHAFCKKSNKTPKKEIDKANAFRKEYFKQKHANKMRKEDITRIRDKP